MDIEGYKKISPPNFCNLFQNQMVPVQAQRTKWHRQNGTFCMNFIFFYSQLPRFTYNLPMIKTKLKPNSADDFYSFLYRQSRERDYSKELQTISMKADPVSNHPLKISVVIVSANLHPTSGSEDQ